MGEEGGWNVVQNTKRRLTPQWTISREDLGSSDGRGIPCGRVYRSLFLISILEVPIYVSKPIGVKRFTKEELLAPRKKPAELKALSHIYPDIISVLPLEPVCTLSLDIDEVSQ